MRQQNIAKLRALENKCLQVVPLCLLIARYDEVLQERIKCGGQSSYLTRDYGFRDRQGGALAGIRME